MAYLIPKAICLRPDESLDGEPPDLRQRINAPVTGRDAWKPNWPEMITPVAIPLGKLRIRCAGDSLTIVSYGRMIDVVQQAIQLMPVDQVRGRVELLDLRTLVPWDQEAVFASVRKTGAVLIVNEDSEQTNFGEHLLRKIGEATSPRIARLLAARHLPGIGLSRCLEEYTIPTPETVRGVVQEMLR